MSYRGTFVTERIDCHKCFKAVSNVLRKWADAIELRILTRDDDRFFAGHTRGLYGSDAQHTLMFAARKEIEELICHKVRFALFNEDQEVVQLVFDPLPVATNSPTPAPAPAPPTAASG